MSHADQPCPHIAIVGGGMVGVTLALMLADQSSTSSPLKITLIEKFPFPKTQEDQSLQPSFDARSTALSAGSVGLLKQLGCWDKLKQHAEPIRDIHISDKGHYGGTLLNAADYDVDALGYVLENRWLGQCLLQRLDELQQQVNIQCLAPATVESCQFTQRSAVLSIRQPDDIESSLEADVVLIADGAESPLRQSLGIDARTTAYKQSAIIANVALKAPHQGVAYERFTEQGPLAVLPLETCDGVHRASVVWTRHNHEGNNQAEALMALDDNDFLSALQDCFGYRAGVFTQVGQRHCYPLELVEATEQVRSRIVIAGNAAHFLHPVAGQGFNLSLRDSAVLAGILIKAHSNGQDIGALKVLSEYEKQREKDQQLTIGLTNAMVKTFSTRGMSLSVMRQLGLLSLQAVPAMKQSLARQMMGAGS